MSGNRYDEAADVRKPTRLEGCAIRIRGLTSRIMENQERIGIVNDRLFGSAPEAVARDNLKTVAAGEYEGLVETIDFLEHALSKLDSEVARLHESA